MTSYCAALPENKKTLNRFEVRLFNASFYDLHLQCVSKSLLVCSPLLALQSMIQMLWILAGARKRFPTFTAVFFQEKSKTRIEYKSTTKSFFLSSDALFFYASNQMLLLSYLQKEDLPLSCFSRRKGQPVRTLNAAFQHERRILNLKTCDVTPWQPQAKEQREGKKKEEEKSGERSSPSVIRGTRKPIFFQNRTWK